MKHATWQDYDKQMELYRKEREIAAIMEAVDADEYEFHTSTLGNCITISISSKGQAAETCQRRLLKSLKATFGFRNRTVGNRHDRWMRNVYALGPYLDRIIEYDGISLQITIWEAVLPKKCRVEKKIVEEMSYKIVCEA